MSRGVNRAATTGSQASIASVIPGPALLAKVVDKLDKLDMGDRDTKGDVYEHMLAKIATAGQNGRFRTPRHIIATMVELVAPKPEEVICDPACGTCGFLVAALEWLRLPSSYAAFVVGKSSLGRRGIIIETAAGVHPGFSGCLTLEIANVGEVPVKLVRGMMIGQLFVQSVDVQAPLAAHRWLGNENRASSD